MKGKEGKKREEEKEKKEWQGPGLFMDSTGTQTKEDGAEPEIEASRQ